MIEAPHFSPAGARKESGFALPEPFFDGAVNGSAMHQAVKVYRNNQRQGTAATKTRAFVSGGNQKPWKQKGTGRARQGSIRAPHWRGGGIVFGPHPRDYRSDIPRKLKQLARKSALNARAAEGRLYVVEQLQFAGPKTARLVELLEKLGVDGQKTLVLTHGVNPALYLSGRNLPRVDVMPYADATAYDVLWADTVVVEEGAFSGQPPAPPVREFRPEPAAPEATQPASKPKRSPKAKAAPKGETRAKAAKKPAAKAKAQAGRKKPATKQAKGSKKPAPKKKGGK